MDYTHWLEVGINNQWIGPPICATHDGLPLTEEEEEAWEEGDDPCMFILRVYGELGDLAALVEANHPPSVWRKSQT